MGGADGGAVGSFASFRQACTFSLRVGIRLLPGNEHECPVFYDLLDEIVGALGDDVIKRLLLDRGFIDGERISHSKRKHGIDILLPVRRSMDVYQDVLDLVRTNQLAFEEYRPPERKPVDAPRLPDSPEKVRKRELERQKTVKAKKAQLPPPPPHKVVVRPEVAAVENVRSLDSCTVPLNAIVNRDVNADGHEDLWVLIDTKPLIPSHGAAERRTEYAVRTDIEEGHRQPRIFSQNR